MNFFYKNPQQDKYFIEISYTLHLAYWMASDIDYFVENFSKLITKKEISSVNKNTKILKKIFRDANTKIKLLNGAHKNCAILLSNYVKHTIDVFLSESVTYTESESEETYLKNLYEIDENFRQSYKKYLCFSDVNMFRLRAFSKLSKAYLSITNFHSYLASEDEDILKEHSLESVIKNLEYACKYMKQAELVAIKTENSTKDFFIAYESNNNHYVKDFYDLELNYTRVWNELLFVYREFYLTFKDSKNFNFLEEYELMLHETTKYEGKINEYGIKICKIILEVMNISLPHIEIFSSKINHNPLNMINLKLGAYD